MIDEADADGSGSINFPEFIELMLRNQSRGQTKDEIKQVQNLALGLEILTMEATFESLAHICKQYMNHAIVVSNSATKPSHDRPIKIMKCIRVRALSKYYMCIIFIKEVGINV